MNIALVTNDSLWHKYWLCKLDSEFNVKLILHPHLTKINNISRIKTKTLRYGYSWALLKLLSLIYNAVSKKSMQKSLKQKSVEYFLEYERQYLQINNNKIYNIDSINSKEALKIIKDNDIDIICNLGGDIYKKEALSTAKIACLNYHSGISPFYNGNKTIFHAVNDFRPNFAGGTLMWMNEKIDGGKILSHYLVPINTNDNAADLFMKNIQGSVKLYSMVIKSILKGLIPKGIEQKRNIKYFKNIDWTISNDIKLRYFEKNKLFKQFVRDEQIINYYDGIGDHTFQKTLFHILNKYVS